MFIVTFLNSTDMSNEWFCYLVLAGLALWTMLWFLVISDSEKVLAQKRQKSIDKGRKIPFWTRQIGQKIGAGIFLTSAISWVLCLCFFYMYMDLDLSYGIFQLIFMSGVIIFWVIVFILIISKIFGIGIANYKPTPEELEQTRKKIEARARRRY
ncbi:MAG: hypothetical protein K2K83_05300 [Rikenella sp.]|nr:hypothetical protein [Rikenella sp.]